MKYTHQRDKYFTILTNFNSPNFFDNSLKVEHSQQCVEVYIVPPDGKLP